MFGAMAPFEKLVVVERPLALEDVVAALLVVAVALVVAMVLVAAAVSLVAIPAAESTHSFMPVIDRRLILSERAFATATVAGLVESTAAFVGFGTNVVNWACTPTGAKSAAERARVVVA